MEKRLKLCQPCSLQESNILLGVHPFCHPVAPKPFIKLHYGKILLLNRLLWHPLYSKVDHARSLFKLSTPTTKGGREPL